jgi:hypothetical protein
VRARQAANEEAARAQEAAEEAAARARQAAEEEAARAWQAVEEERAEAQRLREERAEAQRLREAGLVRFADGSTGPWCETADGDENWTDDELYLGPSFRPRRAKARRCR